MLGYRCIFDFLCLVKVGHEVRNQESCQLLSLSHLGNCREEEKDGVTTALHPLWWAPAPRGEEEPSPVGGTGKATGGHVEAES